MKECADEGRPGGWGASPTLPALEMEGGRAVVAAQEIPAFFAAIAAVVVGGPAASPGLLLGLPTPLLGLIGLGGSQQSLDLLHTQTNGVCAHGGGWRAWPSHKPLCPLLSFLTHSQAGEGPEPLWARSLGKKPPIPSRAPSSGAPPGERFPPEGGGQGEGWGDGARLPAPPLPCKDSGGDSKVRPGEEARSPGTH